MRFHRVFVIVLLLALAPLARGQTFELLHSFNLDDGAYPTAGLIEGKDGNYYGVTKDGRGAVYKITPIGTFSVFATNAGQAVGTLLQGSDGNLYGTTINGGSFHQGNVFSVTTNGILTSLASFSSFNGEGGNLNAGLIEVAGNFYGTTERGGDGNLGTIFKLTTNGIITTLASFAGTDGRWPEAPLLNGKDGFFYGTTVSGGPAYGANEDVGTIFKITPSGVLTMMHSFTFTGEHYPWSGLIEGTDGRFYGTTQNGGPEGAGTIFSINRNSDFYPVASFDFSNGGLPESPLIQATDGYFYGTAREGGANGFGTVFRLNPDSSITTLHSFDGTNGYAPRSGLLQGSDGNFYGTTFEGGEYGFGTVYRIIMPVTLALRLNGNELVLSWPTNQVGFTLQAAANLNSPTNWIDSTNTPAVVGAQFTVTNSLSASAQFYRLKK